MRHRHDDDDDDNDHASAFRISHKYSEMRARAPHMIYQHYYAREYRQQRRTLWLFGRVTAFTQTHADDVTAFRRPSL